MRGRSIGALLVFLVSVSLVAGPGPVSSASVADSATLPAAARRGPCTGVSTWRLRVVALANSELRVRFLIAGGAAGETWNLFLDRDGVGFFAGSRVSGDGGLVTVKRRIADLPGEELIRATAHDVVTGEVCRGRVRARATT